jgi:tetratricopeptide (TPR) repeat protein
MKRILVISFILLSAAAFAQKSNVATAAENYKKYNDLPKAKEAIDLAAQNEATSNDPKMWYYRGAIYLAIYQSKDLSKQYPEAASIAAESFINCLKLDKGHDVINYTDSCNRYLWVAGLGLYNKGIEAVQNNDFERAYKNFNQVLDIIPYDKENNLKRNTINADIVNKNLYIAARKANDSAKQKVYLQRLIDSKFHEAFIYINMFRLSLEDKDTAKAMSYIEAGRKIFEDNTQMMEAEASIYIAQGKTDELISKITQDIETVPDNELLYYRRAKLYEKKKMYDKSEADYKKAIELKPEFLDAQYDLGVMLFNQAAGMANAANDLKSNDEFSKAKEKFEAKFKEAQPYLEKAKELNPNKTDDDKQLYKNTLVSLKNLYVRTNQTDKYNEVKAELDKK